MLTRTGFPFNVTTVDETAGLGFENSDRPALLPVSRFGLPAPPHVAAAY